MAIAPITTLIDHSSARGTGRDNKKPADAWEAPSLLTGC
jgi:hypothetical protein